MSDAASRRRLNEAISALQRLASSRKLDVLHVEQSGVDLNLAAYGVLGKVVSDGPVTLSQLAALAHMAPNALSRQVRLLEEGGHIVRRRHPDDARVSVVEATPDGRDAHRRIREANDRLLSRQLRHWSVEEIDGVATQIERLVADLRRTDTRTAGTDERTDEGRGAGMGARRVVLDGLAFAEGPRWRDGALWLSDMHKHRVLRVDGGVAGGIAGGVVTVALQHDAPVSGLGWLPDASLLTVAMDGFVLRDGEPFADVRHLAPHGVNDMISHPEGWSWVGQFGYDRHAGGRPVPSPLLRVDPDGTVRVAADDLLVANGMGITADGRTLVVAESAGRRLTAFGIGDDGTLHDRRTFAEVPVPDGMCLDAGGAVWMAAVMDGAFLRVAEGGEVLERIEVAEDGRRPIACVLGGRDRRTLFLLTATTMGEAEPSRAALAARVEQVEVEVPGAGWP